MVAGLGIAVANDSLAVALLGPSTPRKRTFPNTPAGHQELLSWLSKQHLREIQACLEATGAYADAIAEALHDAGYWVSGVNPARIAADAKSRLSRNKTDPADALVIAQFAHSEQPARWTPPTPELRELRALVRHLDALHSQRQAERNRQAAGPHSSTVTSALAAHLSFLSQPIASVEQAISEHIDRHPNLKRDRALLTSIKGMGERTATRLLAESGDRQRFANARAWAAYAGLTPRQHQSGSSIRGRTRRSKIGNAALRAALYFPAIVAKKHNPVIQAFCARLAARGLAPKAVIGAAMRKLVHLAYGVLKSGQPFDPARALLKQA
jgi:transposase